MPSLPWQPVVNDAEHRCFAYVLRQADSPLSEVQLREWFMELHPRNYTSKGGGNGAGAGDGKAGAPEAWTDAVHAGETLLRRTSWCTFAPGCVCAYGYADTWQPIAQHVSFRAALLRITRAIEGVCALPAGTFNSVNLNWYPVGGGVGFHADDEFLFDGLRRDVTIISLSLCEEGGAGGTGTRRFQIRAKQPLALHGEDGVSDNCGGIGGEGCGDGGSSENPRIDCTGVCGVDLRHGDLMTMEGLHQLFLLHAVWPGDRQDQQGHPHTRGERINLTFRTITRHLDGSHECRGVRCPLAG